MCIHGITVKSLISDVIWKILCGHRLCFLLWGQCDWHHHFINSNTFCTHRPVVPLAHSCHGSTSNLCARKARVAQSCPGAALGHDEWSRRVSTPASSPSDGTTLRCTSYIPLEILRGMKPQLPTEGACSCTGFSVSLPLSHFLTSWLLLLPNKWLALEFYSQINFWGSPV